MGNNLHKVEKDLRSIAKRYKSVKYSLGLAILFLMLGVSAFSEEVNLETSQIATREDLKTSVDNVQTKLNVLRNDNKEKIKNLRLELIQLMEQGDQVVKSPWSSWQFGMNYFYENWGSTYKGSGDKAERYSFNGIYTRSNWKVRNAMGSAESQRVGGTPLTPGNDSQSSWANAGNVSNGGVTINKDASIGSSTNGKRGWGLVDLENLKEPTNEVEILARISPKEINKEPVALNITAPTVATLEAPKVEPNPNEPIPAPNIKLPTIDNVVINELNINAPSTPVAPGAPTISIGIDTPDAPVAPTAPGAPVAPGAPTAPVAPSVSVQVKAPSAPDAPKAPSAPSAPEVPTITVTPSTPGSVTPPTINISVTPPTITALNITTPGAVTAPNVVSPNITPVDFAIDPAGDSTHYKKTNWTGIPTTVNVTALGNRNYITLNAVSGNVQSPASQIINVTANNNRALVVDEALNGGNVTYKGSINLQKSQNVGIDLQGTHQGSKNAPALLTVNNAGNIIGLAKDGGTINKEQIAFGFNNADASRNTTMSHMINSGTISLNAPSSAGIQLKPEDPHYWQPQYWSAAPLQINKKSPNKTMGRVLMKAENTGNLNLNGIGSFGIVTVFNKGVPKNLFIPSYQSSHEDLRSEREYDGQRVLPGGEIGRSALADDKYRSGIYNTGNINISGDNSIAVGLLQEIQEVKLGGNINIGTTPVTQETGVSNLATTPQKTYNVNKVEEAVGVFAGVPTMPVRPGEKDTLIVDNTLGNVASSLVGTETVELINTPGSNGITLGDHATESIGALVGDTEVDLNNGLLNGVQTTGRKLKRSGDITAKTGYKITVGGEKNYGFVVSNSAHSSKFNTSKVDDLLYSVDKDNHGRGINEGTIDVIGKSSIGFALIKGGKSKNSGTISVKNNAEDSIGFYGKEDEFTNTGTIQVTSSKDKNKAIVLDGTNTGNKIKFTNTGNVFVNTSDNSNTNLNGTGNIGVYAQGNYKFDHNSGTVKAGKNAIAFYLKNATGEVNINAPIELYDSGTGATSGTTIGIYSDGDAKVNFGQNSKITIGKGAVGLYSSDATKFSNTFKVVSGKSLEIVLGQNSTFGLLSGTAGTVNVGTYLKNNSINISNFGSGASIFYTTDGVIANLNEDYTVANGTAASTAVLVGANGSTVKIDTGKTLTTNTNVGLIATKAGGAASTAQNDGNIVSTRDSGIGIYTTESIGNSTGTITMQNKESVGILGENNSTLTNSGKIELQKDKSAGIYGKDSDVTNSGTGTKGIYVKDEKSAGIYGLLTSTASADKTLSNTGLVKVENAGKSGSAGIYAKLDTTAAKKLSTVNSGTIEVVQTGSAGIYAENGSAQANTQSDVTNSGLVKMTGASSVGIIGEKSQITNSGIGTGKGIEIYGTGSAGILANNNSKVINTGRIEGSTGTSLVGISVDKTSTATNSGTITMSTASSSGVSTKGGDVTNSGAITLVGTTSTGISSENANVTNSATTGEIIVKNANSMGIYSKSDGTVARTVSNAGEITLKTPTGVSANKSAAIYSLLDAGSNKLTTTNTGTINVGQEGSAGIYAKNNTGTNTNSVVENKANIKVTKQGSAAILGDKSDITNSKTTGVITLSAFKSAGIIGNNDSKVSNAGKIETTGVSPTKAEEGLVGISLNASTGTNETTGTISLGTDFSTGIYGEASSTLTNAGSITGDKQKAVGMAAKASTATNNSGATITLSGVNSTGMFGLAVGSTKSTLTNSGTINGNGEGAVGIAVNDSKATNSNGATINLTAKKSTGMFGEVGSTVTNAGKIETSTANPTTTEDGLVGIAVNASTATNETTGQIILGTAFSTGMFGENNGSTKSTITNKGSITGNKEKSVGMAVKGSTATNNSGATITLNGTNSTGMFGEANGTIKSDVTNSGTITGTGEGTVGVAVIGSDATNSNGATISLQAKKSTGMFGKTNSTIKNAGKIETKTASPTTTEEGLVGIVLDNSTGTNESTGVINLGTAHSTGMFGENNSTLTNAGNITGTADNAVGMAAKASNATNNATITLNGANSKGMFGEADGTTKSDVVNNGIISGVNGSTVGMAVDGSNATNNAGKSIVLQGKGSTGIFGKNGSIVSNAGKIETKTAVPTSSTEGLVGIALNASTAINETTGEITLGTAHSTGIFGENDGAKKSVITNKGKITGNKDNVVGIAVIGSEATNIQNAKITLNGKSSTGIFGKNGSTVSNAGKIETSTAVPANSTEGLVGIALNASTGTNETSGEIILGTAHSTGMFGENVSTITNKGTITGNPNIVGVVGIATDKSKVTNNNGATITLQGKSSTGIFGKNGSTVSNAGKIETSTAVPANSTEGLVGIALNASTGTNETSGEIILGTAHSTGMFGENVSTITNKGTITGNPNIVGVVGIATDKSKVTNNNGATITLQGKSSTGIFGKNGSTVSNAGKIETKTAVPTTSTEGLVGIALNASTGTNEANGEIILGTAYSTGMFGAATSTVINEGTITGNQLKNVGMAGNASTVTNKNTITLEGKSSTGIFGENNSTLLNDTTGNITVKEEASVGIFSKSNTNKAENKGTILTEKKKSAGMFGNKGELENTNSITTKDEESAGMYVEHSKATNKKTILIEGKASAGIYAKLSEATGGTASGANEGADAVITMKKEGSAGMLGEVKSTVTAASTLTLTNSGNININSKNSTGMMLTNDSASLSKDNVKAENTGTITLDSTTATDNKNIGILANKKATGINSGTINVNTLESVGMLGQAASSVVNKKTINLSAEKGIGMLAKDTDSTATNEDTVNVNGKQSSGMLAQTAGKVENKKSIIVTAESGVGIFVSDTGTGVNTSTGEITLENKNAVGIFAKNNGTTHTAENAGKIVLGKADGTTTHESLIAIFAQAEAGQTASIKNTGTIDVNTKKSVGMYAKNDATNVGDVDLQNTGTINVNNTGSAGIYAPKANISKVGKINLKDSDVTNGSSAVYISKGGKVSDTSSADINLGKVNQNRVAYYVNGKDSSLAGANIGKISGYGVGVYLQGNSKTDVAEINNNTPTLNYTTGDDKGNGIIGLYLNGNTNIQAYTKGITVGDSVGTKYAIGIYANKQGIPGTSGTPYNITTPIQAGANGVGIYADNDSNITYTGNMEIGDGTTAGTGIFITKKVGANGGEATLGSNTIKLKGTGGVAVIASEGTKFDGGNATIELIGTNVQGVGVYAKKGSVVSTNHWTFNNHGNAAEEVRSEEGGAYIDADRNLKPKMVLTHVINGETIISSGKSVTSVADGKYKAEANIGLMAEGVKNPTAPAPLTWREPNFEAVNHGTIDFSNSEKSTAMFINSARAQNDGVIKVGKNSTAIYGFYNKDTRKYDGASTNPDPNILKIETTANSKISLGDSSTGMYLINAETVNNIGGEITAETGSTKNVGIYAVNGQDKDAANNKILNMTTATNIKLGNGSVGLYSKGQSDTVRNTVTNTGNIEVGDKIAGSPSVAMYAENTNLNTDSKIKVGNDGIAFYGKNSDITAKGTVDFSNNGVLAYLENSKFISYLGNLGATKNTMMYLKNSIAQLDGAGTKVDIEVADNYTGAYIEGNSQLSGVKTIKLGENSTGLYLQETTPNFVSNVETITGTKDRARGISAVNSNFTNNSKISLSGEESVAIYAKNASATSKYIVNNGELNLAGKRTLGAFLRGDQTFENKANINIADSADSKNPTIGIYTTTTTEDIKDKAGNVIGTRILEGSNIKHTSGIIEVGEKSIGIYSKASANVDVDGGKIHVKDQGIGIYKEAGKLTIKGELDIDPHVATAKDSEPTGVYAVNGAQVDDQASKISVGEKSYGFILNNNNPTKTNTYISGNTGTVSMGNDSVFLYSNGNANIVNNRTINSNGSEHLIAFYIKNGGDFTNNGTIDFSTGKGNIGVYAPGGKATNRGNIFVGKTDDIDPATGKVYSDVSKIVYGIGMAADNGGHIVNDGTIRIYNNKSIGMYGSGLGTVVENGVNGKILLDGSRATATDKIQSMTGVYVDEGATFRNFGTITTTDSYAGRDGKINENVSGLTGVAVMNGSTLINEASGKILIDADNSSGVVIRGKRDASGNLIRNAVIKNYGEIKVRGKGATAISWKDVSAEDIANLQKMINDKITSDPNGREIGQAAGSNKDFQGISITVQDGKPIFRRNGRIIDDVAEVEKINELIGSAPNLAMSDVGFYVDTLGRTRPVEFEGANPPVNSQLIIGTEYSEKTNKKEWFVSGNVIKPFLDQIQGRNFKLTTLAGSLTWIATPVLDNYGQITGVAMSKLSYTSFVKPENNAYNFADGLEQRYNMNALDSVEKRIFNKLNSIGKNEEVLLTQAFDEMMGHQYANVQQRVQATGMILDKEFSYLRGSWTNPTKDSNKVKTFGMKGEYKTDTAGVLDYKNNAYGVAYVHENEDIKLGKGTGWYTGIVHNTFKFKDIGNSKEEQLQAKVGLFKSVPFDDNNSLNWTISGDIFVGHNKLERKFLVVDEIFHAKSKYYTYGIGVKNEIGKEFRLSEGFSVRPYAALKAEYGRVSKIKEKSGEMKLEVKENDYLSIRPEIGTELEYKHYFGTKSLTASVGLAYENELGRVANGKNKARVAGTTADWFNIRGEKEDRKGNVKVDLNVGLDNQRFGVTGNVGYDTKGSNVRGGVGLRVIF